MDVLPRHGIEMGGQSWSHPRGDFEWCPYTAVSVMSLEPVSLFTPRAIGDNGQS
jgi:hypothetical protein